MTQDWIKPPPPLHIVRARTPRAVPHSERLARAGAVSCPRPRHGPAGHLLAGAVWWLVWAVWWFAAGMLLGSSF